MVLESYAPAAVLINGKHECLYSLGPIHRYLRVAPGHPTQDLLAMASGSTRTKLRSAIHQASQDAGAVIVAGGEFDREGIAVSFDISVQPVAVDGDRLMLVCFIDGLPREPRKTNDGVLTDGARVAELEHELEATRTELQGAIHNLEISSEE